MNSKNSLLKMVFTSIACCLILAAFLAGCGGSNNPAGPTGTTPSSIPTAGSITATGTVTITGSIIDASTNSQVSDAAASIFITVSLIDTTYTKTVQSTGNLAYAFRDLPIGYYMIVAEDRGGKFDKMTMFKSLTVNETINIRLIPTLTNVVTPSLNFHGRVIDTAYRAPIMFTTIKAVSNSGITIEATTLFDGTYSLLGISSGTYTVTFINDSFETTSRQLVINDRIRFDTTEIAVTALTPFIDGSNVSRTGYNLGDVVLAPKIMTTGSLAGILLKADRTPLTGIPLDLVYDDNTQDETPPGTIIPNWTTNSLGYFMAKNLPTGWYMVAYPGYTLTPIISGGEIKGYNFGAGQLVTHVWMKVEAGLLTPIPELQ